MSIQDGDRNNEPERGDHARPLGLKRVLPDLQPPGWIDENIRSIAHEQAKLNAQSTPLATARKRSWLTSKSWFPWAGSAASLGLVLLLVTARPLQPDDPQKELATDTGDHKAATTASEAGAALEAKVTPDTLRAAPTSQSKVEPAKPVEPALQSAKSRGGTPARSDSAGATSATPMAAEVAAAPQASQPAARPAPSPPAPSPPAPSPPASSPPVPAPPVSVSSVPAAADQSVSAPGPAPSTAPSAAASTAKPRTAEMPPSPTNESAKSEAPLTAERLRQSRSSAGAAAAPTNDQFAERRATSDAAPQTQARCAELLDELLLANRRSDAQQMFRRCAERFPDHVWPTQLRERIGTLEPNR